MDIAHVKAAPGSFVKLQVVVTEIKHQNGTYGPYALGKIQDGPGQVEQVLFTVAKGKDFPTDLQAGHLINCAGRFDANTGKMKVFFDSYAQNQAPPPNSYPPQQPIPNAYGGKPTTPSPAASMVAPQPVHVPADNDPTRTSIERQCAWKSACGVAANCQGMELGQIVKWAVRGAKFMADGQGDVQQNPQWVGEDPPPPGDDDIPFS